MTDRTSFCKEYPMALSEATTEPMEAKALMRRAAYDARNAQPDKDEVSARAVARLME